MLFPACDEETMVIQGSIAPGEIWGAGGMETHFVVADSQFLGDLVSSSQT